MKKILVADDEKYALEVLEKRLKAENYDVHVATNGREAISQAKSFRPDLILLDIAMPELDGYTIAARLREDELFRDTPIIFITAKELLPQSIENRLSEIGACDYIMKPCTFEEILARINKITG